MLLCVAAFTYGQEVGPELIQNGGFDNKVFEPWKTDKSNRVFVVTGDDYNKKNGYGREWYTARTSDETWVKMYHIATRRFLYQEIPGSCAYDPKVLDFDLVIDERTTSIIKNDLHINIGGEVNEKGKVVGGVNVVSIEVQGGGEMLWRLSELAPSVKVSITRENGTRYTNPTVFDNTAPQQYYNKKNPWRYHLTVEIDGETAKNILAGGNLIFTAEPYVRFYIDNISLKNKAPNAEKPIKTQEETSCPDGIYNLSLAEPTLDGHTFDWYSDAQGTQLVTDKKVFPGTYYMKTVSTCSGLKSKVSETSITVKQGCPEVNGTLFLNYDGGDFIGNTGTDGGGMFAHLINITEKYDPESINNNKVLQVVAIAPDGTYSFLGPEGEGFDQFRIIISKTKSEVGSLLTESSLNPNYVYAGTTDILYPGNGVSGVYDVSYNEVRTINFGVQMPPTAPSASKKDQNPGKGKPYPINALTSTDDDPNWNNGVGQKMIIKNVTNTNGVLKYDGIEVKPNHEVAAYDPAKLTFTPSTDGDAATLFTYVYVDKADTETPKAGTVNYSFSHTVGVLDTPQSGFSVYADNIGNVVVQNIDNKPLNVQLFDLCGRLVIKCVVNDSELLRIPIQAKGLYVVKVTGSKINYTERVIVK